MRQFTEQEIVRRNKVNELVEKGVKPFGFRFDVTSNSKIIKDEHSISFNMCSRNWLHKQMQVLRFSYANV